MNLIIIILIITNAVTLFELTKVVNILHKQDELLEKNECWVDPELWEELHE
jgi:hypothetical protein